MSILSRFLPGVHAAGSHLFSARTSVTLLHTSSHSESSSAVALLVARPVLKILAVVAGRRLRVWRFSLSDERRRNFASRGHLLVAAGVASTAAAAASLTYASHLEPCPVTDRKRFMVLRPRDMDEVGDYALAQLSSWFRTKLLPETDPAHHRVAALTQRILDANKDLLQGRRDWTVTVVKDDELVNVVSLPGGHIILFTGIFKVCETDDQLGIVLGHEISHVILEHQAEDLSLLAFVSLLLAMPLTLVWAAARRDVTAVLADLLVELLVKVTLTMPYCRKIELEADEVGLILAAKACLDVREAPALWDKMSRMRVRGVELELAATHPTHETRRNRLLELLPGALRLRSECGCAELVENDPLKAEIPGEILIILSDAGAIHNDQ